MPSLFPKALVRHLAVSALCVVFCAAGRAKAAAAITYNRDIRPILSDDCFHCHGPDQKTRKGKFRLDVREDAVAKRAIVPGEPKKSSLVERIFATNTDDVMPPPEARISRSVRRKKNCCASGSPTAQSMKNIGPMCRRSNPLCPSNRTRWISSSASAWPKSG